MNKLHRLVCSAAIACMAWGAAATVSRADVGPRPPMGHREVKDPENWLAMRDETVTVAIQGKVAHVTARFRFETVQSAYRSVVAMRLGFPELVADPPLRNFTVKQSVYWHGGSADVLAPVDRLEAQPVGSGLSAGLKARWKTWALELPGSGGAPPRYDVDEEVRYDQDLAVSGGKRRFTYVLRSGAPWKDPIGHARVQIDTGGAKVVSSIPAGAKRSGAVLVWELKSFEPTQDVTVLLK